jgi:predicted enzyme related to lactoylglutathione lyase
MMASINRFITNICARELPACKTFYQTLFKLEVTFDSDWYVQLRAPGGAFELGIIQQDHPVVPKEARTSARGFYLTLVVADLEAVYTKAQAAGFQILQVPTDTFYGQRQLLLRDPAGVVVDVSTPIADFQG